MKEKITLPLTIHLIKENVLINDILRAEDGIQHQKIGNIGTLYYKNSNKKLPRRLSLFQDYNIANIFSASASAVLIVNEQNRNFALTFGFGKSILNPSIFEEKFGLKTVLGCVDPERIRSIDSKALESELMMTRKQSARATHTGNFGLDIDKDFISSATGIPTNIEKHGNNMSGKDALHVVLNLSANDIKPYLKNFFECYTNKKYKENFERIDQMSEVSDKSTISNLEDKLLEEVNKTEPENIFLTIPEIVERDDVAGYKLSNKNDHEIFDDLDIDVFKNYLDKDEIILSDFKKQYLYLWQSSIDQEKAHWSIYNCMYAEIELENDRYFLSNGKWYKINNNLKEEIDSFYENVINSSSQIEFLKFNTERSEGDYNINLTNTNNDYICLDKQNINFGGGYSKVEFADVYSKKRKIIHIKKYTGSNSMSYLFNQGLVSGEAFFDKSFREKVNQKIELKNREDCKINDISISPNDEGNDYEIIYGIIKNDLNIPFFSKLSLRTAYKRLQKLRYKISLIKIDTLQ